MKLRAYITHKKAEKYSDCADYFGICPQQKKVAVSDGVSQSIMPLEWAKILVHEFLNNNWEPDKDISALQEKWCEQAVAYLEEQRSQGKNPWMLENCISNKDGAGATFCGVTFTDGNHWEAKILGDSCLVLLDENKRILEIISSKDGKFDNRPDYYDSFKEQRGNVRTEKGELKSSQNLLLVSDPFSELFQIVRNSEKEKIIIEQILSLKNYEEYLQLVDNFRESYHMHNDDSTLIIIEHDGNEEFTIDDKLLPLDTLQCQETTLEVKRKQEKEKEIEEQLWQKTKHSDRKEFYEEYLSKYPKGKYSQDAIRYIDNLINKSSESAHGNGQEEQSEPASEDSDRCRRSNIPSKTSTSSDCKLEKVETSNIAVSAAPTNVAAKDSCSTTVEATNEIFESEGTAESSKQTKADKSTSGNTGTTKSTEFAESTEAETEYAGSATIESAESAGKVGSSQSSESERKTKYCKSGYKEEVANQIRKQETGLPSYIDREEFNSLRLASFELLKKHFDNFWLELENKIYKNHG